MDGRTFAVLAAVCLATAIMFGLAPPLHVSKTNEILEDGERTGSGGVRARRWTGGLIIVELALTLALLGGGAGFMMRSFLALYRMVVALRHD